MGSSRLIGAVTVRHGAVVKSYGYRDWRPAGSLRTALRNLDRWNVDEILVLDISRTDGIDHSILDAVSSAGLSTPLMYGGGIRGPDDLDVLMSSGVDRVLIETIAWSGDDRIRRVADRIGVQAVVVALPVIGRGGVLGRRNPTTGQLGEDLEASLRTAMALPCSEVLIIDADAEGRAGRFSPQLGETVLAGAGGGAGPSFIWFGGLDADLARRLLAAPRTSGVAFGNVLHERELVVPLLRDDLRRGRGRASLRRTGLRNA